MYASGKYSTCAVFFVKVTATMSKWHSLLPNGIPRLLRRKPFAALAILLCFVRSTFSCGGACMFSRRAFTSTKCIPSAAFEMMSISRCPVRKLRSRIRCPLPSSSLQAMSSPWRPVICLLFPLFSILPPHPSEQLLFPWCFHNHPRWCRTRSLHLCPV